MKTKFSMLIAAAAAFGNISASFADGPFAGVLAAGSAAVAPTDVYRLACPLGTASVRARLTNPNGNAADEMAVQVISPSGLASTGISLEGVAPPTVIRAGVPGNYLVSVHKDSTLLSSRYSLTVDCYRANATAITGNQTTIVQNQ